jgi:hypothetical protein
MTHLTILHVLSPNSNPHHCHDWRWSPKRSLQAGCFRQDALSHIVTWPNRLFDLRRQFIVHGTRVSRALFFPSGDSPSWTRPTDDALAYETVTTSMIRRTTH